jgi:Holliday junction resolvase
MYQQVDSLPETGTFTWGDLNSIDGLQFEALISLVLREQGYHTLLTPRGNDYGADVVAIKENIAYLVQCKKGLPDAEVIEELNSAFDSYIQWIPRGQYKIAFALAFPHKTNRQLAGISKKANREIILWDQDALKRWLKNTSITRSDILAEDMQRLSTAKDVSKYIQTMPV